MTSLAVMLVAPVVLGVDFGWQPVAGTTGIEFMIRLSPEQLEDLRNGEDVLSDLPPGMEMVHTYRITTDPSELPNEGKPPRKRQTALASTGTPMLDPVTGQTLSNGFNSAGPQPLNNNQFGNNSLNGPAFPNPGSNTGGWNTSSLNNNSTATNGFNNNLNNGWNNNSLSNNGLNNRTTGGNYLNQGTFPQPPLNNPYQSQPYGQYLTAELNPNQPNYQLAANTPNNGFNQPQNNFVTQPGYNNQNALAAQNNAGFRPNGATLAGVTTTRSIAPANWIATLVALGLSLGANAYLGMLSIGLYNRCRVLLGQLRFSTLRG